MKYFLDFEATQFSERIISIGCINEKGDSFYTLVKPAKKKDKVNKFITRLTGITNEMLVDAPSPDVAFNALFDFVLLTSDGEPPEYFCYGNSDASFIRRTISGMTDTRAITFATSMSSLLQDYAECVKRYFNLSYDVSLKRAYILIQQENIEQTHNALDDAKMLLAVAQNMEIKCSPQDADRLKEIKVEKKIMKEPTKDSKWSVATGADENNWKIHCHIAQHHMYFLTMKSAIDWLKQFYSNAAFSRKWGQGEALDNQLKKQIIQGIKYRKQSFGLFWEGKAQ
jgi:inhibitor of KinA sporulation pathway (predicted exonuclease)